MIDFENYERVTRRNEHSHGILKDVDMVDLRERLTFRQMLNVGCALERLAELEDLIEKGKLVPAFFVVDDKYGFWNVGHFDKDCYDFYQCYTKEQAETKLKELLESDENE